MTDLHGEFFGGVAGTSDMVSKSSNGVLQQNNRSQASSSNTISSSVGLALNCHIKNTLLRYRQGRKLSKSLLGLANNSRKMSVFCALQHLAIQSGLIRALYATLLLLAMVVYPYVFGLPPIKKYNLVV